jgi:Uma2 family endonuclease
MSDAAIARMLPDEFLEWGLRQDLRYERVDGIPYAWAGAKRRHDRIVMNLHAALVGHLRGHRCVPFSADTAVRIPAGNIRRPDAGIDCGQYEDDALAADLPYLVLEVLSPTTRNLDMFQKLEEYKTVPSIAHIVLVDPDVARAIHWSRTVGGAWQYVAVDGLDSAIRLPEIGYAFDLGTIYEGLTFLSRPRVVVNS